MKHLKPYYGSITIREIILCVCVYVYVTNTTKTTKKDKNDKSVLCMLTMYF